MFRLDRHSLSMVNSLSFRFTVANDIVIKGHENDTFHVKTRIFFRFRVSAGGMEFKLQYYTLESFNPATAHMAQLTENYHE